MVTDSGKAARHLAGDSTQWADYGVNVGHDVHGVINVYLPHIAARTAWCRIQGASPISGKRHAAARSALTALGSACELAATALSYVGLMGPEKEKP
ncbi:hypothetical protein [Streptomyces sp. NPDC048111]|uniref:hypothetical protein n=1 Tax=Streptomyces sp. NPDC048111 TaxID=3365500 RepID=UPI003713AB29